MKKTSLLGISGSLRRDATNRKLVREAARLYGDCDYIEADIDFPLFNADVQNADGIPDKVQKLSDQIAEADGILISCPEYNKALSGAMKNALDWISRTEGNPWKDKPVAIMSASAGRAGGERSQFSLRLCMVAFRPYLLQGPEVMLAQSGGKFDEHGRLNDERAQTFLTDLMAELQTVIAARRG